jgi:flagellar biosynthesis protein
MTPALPSPRRKVTLRVSSSARTRSPPKTDTAEVEAMLASAHAQGMAPSVDPHVAAVLAAVRLRDDLPKELYVVLAAVLGAVHAAGSVD